MKTKSLQEERRQDYLWAFILLAPLMLGLLIFYFIPFFQNFFYSFTNLSSFGKYKWIGLANFTRLFKDPEVYDSFKNTTIYTIFSVPISTMIAIVIAFLLNTEIKGKTLYRVLYFLPAVTMPLAIGMVWRWIYNGEYGLLNQLLNALGFDSIAWLTDPDYTMVSLIIVGVWSGIAMKVIYFLAGLQTIPREYYEAADVDGANEFEKFFKITLPLLTPTIFFITITSLIGSFQMFDLLFSLIPKGGMGFNSTRSIIYLFYQHAFEYMDKGYASAISIVVFLFILLITSLQLKFQDRWVNY